jgi:enolase
LFVTNATRLSRGIHDGIANSILKVNQIGTLTETINAVVRNSYTSVMTARVKPRITYIADLWRCTQDKSKRICISLRRFQNTTSFCIEEGWAIQRIMQALTFHTKLLSKQFRFRN